MTVLGRARLRCRQILSYSMLSMGAMDAPKLAVLGVAKWRSFSRPDLVSRIGRKLFPLLNVRPRLLKGVRICIDPSDPTHLEIFDEVVIENVYDLQRVQFDPDLIIDCGAHIGLFVARARSVFPNARLIVFEPERRNSHLLKQMININRIAAEVHNEAVSDMSGSLTFYLRGSHGGSLNPQGGGVVGSYCVPVVNIIPMLQSWRPKRLLLKMDIEGEEENLLPKMIDYFPPESAIFFETHSGQRGWKHLQASLSAAGFEVHLLRERGVFMDGFASRSPSALSAQKEER